MQVKMQVKIDDLFEMQVKITKPTHYLVRPNQSVLDVGGRIDVILTLQLNDVAELIADYNAGGTGSSDRILVQALRLTAIC